MNTLFPMQPIYPSGFRYLPNFINKEEEDSLLCLISTLELRPFKFQGYEAKRKVASYGFDWSFETRTLSKGKSIPSDFNHIIGKVASLIPVNIKDIGELLVTEYPDGSVINWHRDAPPFDIIVGISLLTDCKFRFRPYKKSMQTRSSLISIPVQGRSLYIIEGEARTDWEHSIAPVKTKRLSITLRTLRGGL
ncbi:alpha-ketoglutarate-dependent dioxygenase AlkB [Desertivirga arenae]|uniref:alpha-ketoglutarate-dependent dioxygenase AlkB n=1 Tax=Desertivirga arenae TaxID=2810309 RepID=UPI001A9659DD|nr:alpha-ketoglutarate-dependent dioxygenase AlkB [Pedobacter sp. SYSU D00823]